MPTLIKINPVQKINKIIVLAQPGWKPEVTDFMIIKLIDTNPHKTNKRPKNIDIVSNLFEWDTIPSNARVNPLE